MATTGATRRTIANTVLQTTTVDGRVPSRPAELRGKRLLLRQTVQRTKTPNQIYRVNADYSEIGKHFCEDAEGGAAVDVIERRNQDRFVSDIEVRVACRQLPSPEKEW